MAEPTAVLNGDTLVLGGDWTLTYGSPAVPDLPKHLTVDAGNLGEWDSTLPAFLWSIRRKYGRDFSLQNLPQSARNISRLLQIASEASSRLPEKIETQMYLNWRQKWCNWVDQVEESLHSALSFLGEIVISLGSFFRPEKKHFRTDDWLKQFHEVGWKALPIVALISFLVGLIVAFVSAVQLNLFGATIYVADLVGLSMTREMGALMTAIIMAGRTGAAYAAQIGSMKRSEELDALRTMGLNPVEMVVVPRVVALTCMIPLLSIFAVFLGCLAGLVICDGFFGLSSSQFLDELARSVGLKEFLIGFIKAFFYGFLVAFAGAWRGIRCGDTADAVGKAATSAVVLGITLIIVVDGAFAVILNALQL